MIHIRLHAMAGALVLLASPLAALDAEAADKVVMQIDGAAAPFYAPLYAGVETGV